MMGRGKSPVDNGQLACFLSPTVSFAMRIIDLKVSSRILPAY